MIAFVFAAGCGGDDTDPNDRVSSKYEGRLAADLLREIGPPTRSRPLAERPDQFGCNAPSDRAATRELSYDVPSRGFWKRAYDAFGLSPARTYLVCVDDTDRITSVMVVEIN